MAPTASSGPLLSDLDERLGGNTKPFMQSPDHFERKRAPAIRVRRVGADVAAAKHNVVDARPRHFDRLR